MFRRILVANRGEIAARILHTCRRLGIETVAVHSEADRDSPHLGLATQAVCIGPPRSADSYLKMEAILQAALQTDCLAIHPGYGFLSENPLFARRCQLQKTTLIGPSPRALALMGDKSEARRTMRRLGLQIIPGSDGTLADAREAARAAAAAGYPVLLKASAGGGGKGLRIARTESEVMRVFPEAAMEAEKAFSNPSLYLEKLIEPARHIEVQVLADSYGRALHLGERECSLQRSHQKLVEESPSPCLLPAERGTLGRRAAGALAAAGYTGAGTVEFLRSSDGSFFFLEVNARIQVEHPVTEMVAGIDLVEAQIRIAANEPLPIAQEQVVIAGCAIEFRINAEDPDAEFRPDAGTITVWSPPAGVIEGPVFPGSTRSSPPADAQAHAVTLRLDSHVRSGYAVPPFYDSLLGKLIVHAPDRPRVLEAAARAVAEFHIEGVRTTLPLHARILASPGFRSGNYDLSTLAGILASASPEAA